MPLLVSSAGRCLVIAGLICLSLAACGRRGSLEEPPAPAGAAAPGRPTVKRVERAPPSSDPVVASVEADEEGGPEDVADAIVPSPTPARPRRSRAVTIPKEPFFLDPLL